MYCVLCLQELVYFLCTWEWESFVVERQVHTLLHLDEVVLPVYFSTSCTKTSQSIS